MGGWVFGAKGFFLSDPLPKPYPHPHQHQGSHCGITLGAGPLFSPLENPDANYIHLQVYGGWMGEKSSFRLFPNIPTHTNTKEATVESLLDIFTAILSQSLLGQGKDDCEYTREEIIRNGFVSENSLCLWAFTLIHFVWFFASFGKKPKMKAFLLIVQVVGAKEGKGRKE